MRWKKARRSDNVVDQRGKGGIGGKGLSLGAVAVIVVVGLLSGQDPMQNCRQHRWTSHPTGRH